MTTAETSADTETGSAAGSVGVRIDQTCQNLVGLFALGIDVDIARGGNSVSGIEELAAVASELARTAPAEPSSSFLDGEPRESLESFAEGYRMYLDVLSEGGLEPGPDVILEPRIAEAMEDMSFKASVGLVPWMEARCSADVKDQIQNLGE